MDAAAATVIDNACVINGRGGCVLSDVRPHINNFLTPFPYRTLIFFLVFVYFLLISIHIALVKPPTTRIY